MRTIDVRRALPVSTAERVATAWADAHPVVRRALVAACVTSAALSTAVPAAPTVRWSIVVVGALLAVAAIVDIHEHKLPNRLLALAATVAVGGAAATLDRTVTATALAGMLIAGGLMLLVQFTRGVGMGDVKMAAVIGASNGAVALVAAPVAIAIAAFAAAAYGLLAGRHRLPLGPALWLGWALSLTACTTGWLS